jgi:cell division protein FtsZ
MIVIPNEKLLAVAQNAGFFESFRVADDILGQAVQGISDIITIPGIINRDFADVKTIMAGMGYAVMGTASAKGDDRAAIAAERAIASPLLEAGAMDGARGILINITGSSSLKLAEVNQASTIIQSAAHEDANIIFGAVLNENMKDEVKITVIATGFRSEHGVHHDRAHAVTPITQPRIAPYNPPPPMPEPVASGEPQVAEPEPERVMAAATAEPAPERSSTPQREYGSLDEVKSSVKGSFEDDDLDVPAFIRKRAESM